MNPTVKSIISFLLKFPIYYVLVNGLVALFGLNIWLCVFISVFIVLLYDIGEMIRRGD
jgi:hypothetical protein